MKDDDKYKYSPFKITAENIQEFAKIIGLSNPIYFNRNAAIEKGFRDIPIPPTFSTVIEYMNKHNLYHCFDKLGISAINLLHGEQSYEYIADIFSGDIITAELTIEKIKVKETNVFYYFKTVYQNQFSENVLICKATLIERKGDL